MVSLKQLKYALAVAKTKHFKRAADDCAISQSALSTAIGELENCLGFQLFERDNKQVLISALGKQALAKAKTIVEDVESLERLGRQQAETLQFPLSIGVIPTVAPFLFPKVLPKVRAEFPEARLTLIEQQSPVLVESVRRGELDTAVVALPYDVHGLHAFEFWAENFYWIVHEKDKMAKRKRIKAKDIDPDRLLLLEDGHCLKDHALEACRMTPSLKSTTLAGTSLTMLIQMVCGKMGTTLVPEMALDSTVAQSSELVAIKLNEPGPHRRLAFITRLNFHDVKSVDWLANCFARILRGRS